MNVHLAYGRAGLDVDIPDRNLLGVLTMPHTDPVDDPVKILHALLETPMGGHPLAVVARGARSACIVVCDITRPVPNSVLLPPVLSVLQQAGVPQERTTILIATGLHRPSSPEERVQLLGEGIARSTRIVDHHARVPEEQRSLGTTRRGTPVFVDEAYCAADVKITTGFIEPHLMAGFSGGRKLIAPGCAGEETIKALHSPTFIEHPLCREGSLEGNPLHEELLAIARMAGHDFMVNVALDADRRITGLFVGDPLEAHERGVIHVRRAVSATLPEPADIVVTTSAGYPLDLTLYQAVKGMTAAAPVLKRGGTMVIAAECAEGMGSREFTSMATGYPSARHFLDSLQHTPVRIDQWQLEECAKVALDREVILVARGIPAADRKKLFIDSADSVEEGLRMALRRHGDDARVAVIPRGPYTLVGVPSPE